MSVSTFTPRSTITHRALRRVRSVQLLGLLRTFDDALVEFDDADVSQDRPRIAA